MAHLSLADASDVIKENLIMSSMLQLDLPRLTNEDFTFSGLGKGKVVQGEIKRWY